MLKNQFKYPLHTLRKHRMSHIISKALYLIFQPVKRSESEYKLEITKCNKVLKNQFKYPLHTLRIWYILSKALYLIFKPVKRSVSEYKLEITKCNEVLKNQFKYPLHTLRKCRMLHIISKANIVSNILTCKRGASEYKLEIY